MIKKVFAIVLIVLLSLLFCTSCDNYSAPNGGKDRFFNGVPSGGPSPEEIQFPNFWGQ